ncbi:uncharacterized protein LOC120628578 [Pararge aegeria]|uniref:uncharacterized protein LOC120628578 n=1 Tax=Pararge aegeria TaxID=116150 RepID=UPI0019CF6F72|nr:uncharacterized protein LOC120628578 [Pararge aegeria]
MKSYIILVFAVTIGFDFVVTNSILKQTVADKDLLLSESNDSSTNHDETLSNNSQTEPERIETNVNGETIIPNLPIEETMQIAIGENFQDSMGLIDFKEAIDNSQQDYFNNDFNLKEQIDTSLEDDFELVKESDYYYNDLISKDPNEIMQTAAGFVPIPIFRKKQKHTPRRQYATRRYNRRPYASRRNYFFYPYYSYYRPSSLRYYYY